MFAVRSRLAKPADALRRVLSRQAATGGARPVDNRGNISPEHFVTAVHQALVGRDPDDDLLALGVEHIKAGTPLDQLVRTFVSSPEFREFLESTREPPIEPAEEPPAPSPEPDEQKPLDSVLEATGTHPSAEINILLLQSADPFHYYDMLAETSRTVRRFCQANGLHYECYIGIKRGYFSWHAAYNRITLLKEMIDSGFLGWVLYIDADAYIADHTFNLRAYLWDKSDYAAIFVKPSKQNDAWYHVNDGIFFLNTAAPEARDLVYKWHEVFMNVSEQSLSLASAWGDLPHDQDMLHDVLRDNDQFKSSIFMESPFVLGWDPTGFIRQFTRGEAEGLAERKRIIKSKIDQLLGSADAVGGLPELTERQAKAILSVLFKGLLGQFVHQQAYDQYTPILCQEGLQYGLQRVVDELVDSAQFKSRFTSGDDVELNYDQARIVASALYRSLFEREPDWHALNYIPALLREQGLDIGLQSAIRDMMKTEEFSLQYAARKQNAEANEL